MIRQTPANAAGAERVEVEQAARALVLKSETALEDLRHWLDGGATARDIGAATDPAVRKAG